jgi:transposase
MAQKLIKNSKLSNRTLGKLVDFFVLEVTAVKAARILRINRHSAESVYQHIRKALAADCDRGAVFHGVVEVDESYFGGIQKGFKGRAVITKVPVFGIFKRNGTVYTQILEDVTRYSLEKIIRKRISLDTVIYSDSFTGYQGLVVYGYKHHRIDHHKHLALSKKHHINGIENFWGYTKTRLQRYHGIDRKYFYYYLKEMEFRFNHRQDPNLGTTIRKLLLNH